MILTELNKHLKVAIHSGAEVITSHVEYVQSNGRANGIESTFANFLHGSFRTEGIEIRTELTLGYVGVEQRFKGRTTGRVDCFLPECGTALEYKAVRLPRLKSSPKYDLGQILADYLRMESGSTLTNAYIIVFLYGPVVADCRSPKALYRRFHNQMFVDQDLASQTEELSQDEKQAITDLQWYRAHLGPNLPEWVVCSVAGNIGAVGLQVFGD